MNYEPIVGLEVHIHVKTRSKMFCGCSAAYFGAPPNSFTCPVCLGLPGAMPVPNKVAIEKCLKLALALNCEINQNSKFDRKNYFYPDLPKGYQISQYDLPIGHDGYLEIDTEGDSRRIRITRVHIEEDTGKSLHDGKETLLDFNKSGIPLIEVVTEPDFANIKEVTNFSKRLRQIVRYLEVSDADMEKGQMRFELNMSLRKVGERKLPNYKVEVKNIGSISVLEKVIDFESSRQQKLLAQGEQPYQETRGLRDLSGKTYSQRIKEEADDYRYFPEPDIPPLTFTDEYIIKIGKGIGELPQVKKARFIKDYGLEGNAAEVLIKDLARAAWFEQAVTNVADKKLSREIAKWLIGDVIALLNADKLDITDLKFSPVNLRNLVELLVKQKISGTIAKQVLHKMYKTGIDPEKIIAENSLAVMDDEAELEEIVQKVIAENPKVVADLVKNPNIIKFLLGKVMLVTKGRANPHKVEHILQKLLK